MENIRRRMYSFSPLGQTCCKCNEEEKEYSMHVELNYISFVSNGKTLTNFFKCTLYGLYIGWCVILCPRPIVTNYYTKLGCYD